MKFFKAAIQILPFGETKYKRVKKKKRKERGGERSLHAFMISKKLCSMSIMCP